MLVPNKITTLKESVLGKITYILDQLQNKEEGIVELYHKTAEKFEDINEYILAIDVLFVLDAIEYTQDKKVIKNAKGN
jgi:hypothetical protein